MRKFIVFVSLLAILPCISVADETNRVQELITLKQSKLEKLKKCKGTTKNLKIAGLSTLGITTVGIGVNIAEAVILKQKQNDLAKAKKPAETLLAQKCKQLGKGWAFWDDSNKTCYVGYDQFSERSIYINQFMDATKCVTEEKQTICEKDGLKYVVQTEELFKANAAEKWKEQDKTRFADICRGAGYTVEDEDDDDITCIIGGDKNTPVSEDTAKEALVAAAKKINQNPLALCEDTVENDRYVRYFISCYRNAGGFYNEIAYFYKKTSAEEAPAEIEEPAPTEEAAEAPA